MPNQAHLPAHDIRTLFSRAMSDMYRTEVPQYGTLMQLVADVNASVLTANPDLKEALERNDDLARLDIERHGAIRLGTAAELNTMRRLFAVMGMHPVGYYDLSVAGVPVHSTCFRPVDDAALAQNPFRVFTSLLRLELIEDEALRAEAAAILARRQIFTRRAITLIETFEANGGLTETEAKDFVTEALETFRWHRDATVTAETYDRLHDAHRLIADVVSFKGPHINHLTPRTLDIDAIQVGMPQRGIAAKAVIEGPPTRNCPILLRQTSFKALEETVIFAGTPGKHTARFGEIEQRGVALTPKGRSLYDKLLDAVRDGDKSVDYDTRLATTFESFPDDWATLRQQGLAFFRYKITDAGLAETRKRAVTGSVDDLIAQGFLSFDPITYEDFLPVSAAGIFQSNLGSEAQARFAASANRAAFERDLGAPVADEMQLYAEAETSSLTTALAQLAASRLAV